MWNQPIKSMPFTKILLYLNSEIGSMAWSLGLPRKLLLMISFGWSVVVFLLLHLGRPATAKRRQILHSTISPFGALCTF